MATCALNYISTYTLDYHSYAIRFKALFNVRGAGLGPKALLYSSLQSKAFHYIPLSSSVHDVIFPKNRRRKKSPRYRVPFHHYHHHDRHHHHHHKKRVTMLELVKFNKRKNKIESRGEI